MGSIGKKNTGAPPLERGYFILWQQAIVCACLNGSYPVLFSQEGTKVAVEREKNKHEIVYAFEKEDFIWN